jgi:hypothetical protein
MVRAWDAKSQPDRSMWIRVSITASSCTSQGFYQLRVIRRHIGAAIAPVAVCRVLRLP